MATAHSPATPAVQKGVPPLRAGQGNSFFFRKLHSLLGVVPLGAFLLEHLLSNFEALKGPIAYGDQGHPPTIPGGCSGALGAAAAASFDSGGSAYSALASQGPVMFTMPALNPSGLMDISGAPAGA